MLSLLVADYLHAHRLIGWRKARRTRGRMVGWRRTSAHEDQAILASFRAIAELVPEALWVDGTKLSRDQKDYAKASAARWTSSHRPLSRCMARERTSTARRSLLQTAQLHDEFLYVVTTRRGYLKCIFPVWLFKPLTTEDDKNKVQK